MNQLTYCITHTLLRHERKSRVRVRLLYATETAGVNVVWCMSFCQNPKVDYFTLNQISHLQEFILQLFIPNALTQQRCDYNLLIKLLSYLKNYFFTEIFFFDLLRYICHVVCGAQAYTYSFINQTNQQTSMVCIIFARITTNHRAIACLKSSEIFGTGCSAFSLGIYPIHSILGFYSILLYYMNRIWNALIQSPFPIEQMRSSPWQHLMNSSSSFSISIIFLPLKHVEISYIAYWRHFSALWKPFIYL